MLFRSALDRLIQDGKIRYIGASSGPAWVMMKALSVSERNGWARFATMQNHYNALYREEEREMIPLCLQEEVGVIPWSPMARGYLTRPAAVTKARATARSTGDAYSIGMYDETVNWAIVDAVERIATARGLPMAQVALAWLLKHPAGIVPIVGSTKPEKIREGANAPRVELTREEWYRLLEAARGERLP